ncbi:AsmA-like C-terminal region-containing protein [Nonlabens xiamenensis]|uniref:AsmA-like C-terminal region-containing protein n=1 Tax=Nonlabens xiamenensis TaxID=2341043 RepID=UPI000F60B50A|nr:AsmA-like C-terminal region-containing protein [Nonlabens xiamenensis]
MKKLFKILGVLLLTLVVLIIAAPFFLQDQIAEIIKNKLNASMDAQIDFAEVDLSLFRAFPDARLSIDDLSIINNAPFQGDTLFYGKEVKLDLPIGDLFNNASDPIHINELIVNEAVSRLYVNEEGRANWEITKESPNTAVADTSSTAGFSFDLKHYEFNNSELTYHDKSSKNKLVLSGLNHSGNGDFSLATSTLDTYTEALVLYSLDDIEYLSGQKVRLEADILMDLENQKYTFQENQAFVNDLELGLDGFVDLEEDYTMVDLSFDTPSSDFSNFFALIPETYRQNMEGITTTGEFIVQGMIKGEVDDNRIPKMDIQISSNNASFKYPDLPQKVTNINIDARLKNETGNVDDTFLDIAQTSFNIGGDRLSGSAMITNLTTNMNVDLIAKGNLDFNNLKQAFPLPENTDLNGQMALDIAAQFDMESIEKQRYDRINTKGTASLTDFVYMGEALTKPLNIQQANLDLSTARIKLKDFSARTGNTDLQVNGTIDNLIGFMIQDQDLKGVFNLQSNSFDTADFMTQTEVSPAQKANSTTQTSTGAQTEEAIQIPAFLDATLDFQAGTVYYDGLTLKNVSGVATVRDETLTLNNTMTNIFDGSIGVNGSVSTKGTTPTFNMALDMKNLDIAQSFDGFDMFKNFVPIISALNGKINTDITLNGSLDQELSPILNTLVGDAFAKILTKDINAENNPLLGKLDEKLSFIDLDKWDLSEITTKLDFKDGAVQVQPFDFNIKGIKATASGRHSLTNEMDYTLNLDVPARYFGKEGANLLSKLEAKDIENITVPVPVSFGGSFQTPKINVNLDTAVKNLTAQIVEIQKQRLKDKGEDALGGAIDDIIQGNNPLDGIKDRIRGNADSTRTTTKDSTRINTTKDPNKEAEDKLKETAGGLIRGLLGRKSTEQDTTKTQ